MNRVEQLPAEIAEALELGAIVVTGNQRSARTLRYAFDLRNKEREFPSWQSPRIFAWDAWTTSLWRKLLVQGNESRLLMNSTQEHSVWHKILSKDAGLQSLRSMDALATLAADAWLRLCAYRGQSKLRGSAASADTLAFERWAVEFHRICRDNELLARAELEDALTSAAKDGHLRLDQNDVVLYGFDRMNPAQAGFMEALRVNGCRTSEAQQSLPAKSRLVIQAENEEQEIRIAALSIRNFLAQNPEARIAVVLPSLNEYRARIDSAFREILAPELQHIASAEDAIPYEFSLGTALAQVPMVRTALDLLHLYAGPISIDQASALLLSPYFAVNASEPGARAEFDAFEIRQEPRLRPEISLGQMSAAAYRSRRRLKLGELPAALQAMNLMGTQSDSSARKSHTEWAQAILNMLETARWATGQKTSVEFQICKKWESALDELSSLDFDGTRVEFHQALASLEHITAQTVFAPVSRQAPVQIMGALEAAGSRFDAVWLMRAGDLSWPVPEVSTPLLSWRLQRDLKMPGTEVSHDSILAHKLTERILSSAPKAIVSFSVEAVDGQQQLSRSLDGLGLISIEPPQLHLTFPNHTAVSLESLDDGDPIQALPNVVVRGGSQVLKHQAQCPFRAFAEHRLRSVEIRQSASGMDAAESGIAIHRALELFWNEIKTQQALKQMTSYELSSALDRCIQQSLARMNALAETSWDTAYMEMQHIRIHRLLTGWLELEMQRAPFEVKANEVSLEEVQVGPLRLKVRIDRIDIAEGGEILIDYKTGDVSPTAWLTDRPDEPQLPLYASIAGGPNLQGVAFGLVRAGEKCAITGFGTNAETLPNQVKLENITLKDQIEEWRRVLGRLAQDFQRGECKVDPKSYPETCKSCSQRILCRLNPSQISRNQGADEVENG